jgi:hypothetical protein
MDRIYKMKAIPEHPVYPVKMPPMELRITEIFLSIQGESSQAGRPCSFVRLTGLPDALRLAATANTHSPAAEHISF